MRTWLKPLFLFLLSISIVGCANSTQSTHLNTNEFNGDDALLTSNYLQAILAEDTNDTTKASATYLEALKEDPNNLFLLDRAFKYQLASGNIKTAVKLAKRFEKMNEPHPIVLLLLAVDAANDNDMQGAKNYLKKAKKDAPKLLQFELVNIYLNIQDKKDVWHGIKKLQNYDEHPSLSAYKLFHLARLQEMLGDKEKTIEAYEKAYLSDPTSVFVTFRLAALYELNNQQEKALETYKNFEAINPETLLLHHVKKRISLDKKPALENFSMRQNLANVMFGFGTLMASQRIPIASRQMMRLALHLEPDHPYAPFYLAVLEEQAGRFEIATDLYESVDSTSPTWLGSQVRIAEILFHNGQKTLAKNMLQNLLKDDHEQPGINRALAEMYYREQDFDRAVRYFSRVLNNIEKPNPRHARLFFARGAANERLKKFDDAADDMLKSLSLNPNDPTVLNYLGYMWANNDENLEQAFMLIGKALIMRPDDGSITDSLGWALFKMGKFEKALVYLERAAEMLPEDSVVNAHLGDVYAELGREEEARKQWQRALDIGLEDKADQERVEAALAGARKTSEKKFIKHSESN